MMVYWFKAACIVYLPLFIYWLFFEITGLLYGPTGIIQANRVPWPTLSEFIWADESAWRPLKVLLLVGLIALAFHFAKVNLTKFIQWLAS